MLAIIVFMPLISAFITGMLSSSINKHLSQAITSTFIIISALCSWILFFEVDTGKQETIELLRWIDTGGIKANWHLHLDSLTAVMLVVVTTVSSLVHIYSIGYMHEDPHIPRFMSYLSLFTFFMLMLVTSDNLIQLFFGWEGVGLCSYLLISFWFHKPSATKASIKAFVINRVGDFFFVLGIFTVFIIFGSVEFSEIFSNAGAHKDDVIEIFSNQHNAITVMCVLLFFGAMGKSAQIGLHTWLPDAMEGPTPVSALIHAATMVTAGVFLVARFSPLFEYSEDARILVTYVGGFTALFAATIAVTQNDIKKIVAYSTCSQLGYMFFACGVSAYAGAIFHLMTHAFFKALLFLSAGSVIHSIGGEQDIRKMGNLWKKIPYTYTMMFIGSLALTGIYPFAGYYSKDAILEAAFANGTNSGITAYWLGLAAAFLTAFYSWRLIIKVFHGKSNVSPEAEHHIHESPKSMLIPLIALTIGAIFAGLLGKHLGMINPDAAFWHQSIISKGLPNIFEKAEAIPFMYKILPLVIGLGGIISAYLLFCFTPGFVQILVNCYNPLYKAMLNKWYIDEIYDFIIVKPCAMIGTFLWQIVDVKIIDKYGPGGAASCVVKFSQMIRNFQTGYIFHYAFVMIVAVTIIITWYIWISLA